MTIDENLTLKKQVNLVVKSCNNQLGNIYFIKKYVTKTCLKMIVFNQIISRLDYCNSAYIGLPKYLIRKMQIILNKAARLVSGSTVDERITPELINLHWLPINYKICYLVHIARLSQKTSYLYKLITSTRNRLFVPRVNSSYGKRTFSYNGPVCYNSLPEKLQYNMRT